MTETIKLLKHARDANASDLHLSSGSPIMMRIHGTMTKLDDKPLSEDLANRLLDQILTPEQKDLLKTDREIDYSLEIPEVGRFRVNVFFQRTGIGAVFRAIPSTILSMSRMSPAFFSSSTCSSMNHCSRIWLG